MHPLNILNTPTSQVLTSPSSVKVLSYSGTPGVRTASSSSQVWSVFICHANVTFTSFWFCSACLESFLYESTNKILRSTGTLKRTGVQCQRTKSRVRSCVGIFIILKVRCATLNGWAKFPSVVSKYFLIKLASK